MVVALRSEGSSVYWKAALKIPVLESVGRTAISTWFGVESQNVFCCAEMFQLFSRRKAY